MPALLRAGLHRRAKARVDVRWTGPSSLRVTMDEPALDWALEVTATRLLRALNVVSWRMPLWTWKRPPFVRARELIAQRLLGMGAVRMRGAMPSGHVGTLMSPGTIPGGSYGTSSVGACRQLRESAALLGCKTSQAHEVRSAQ